MIEVKVVQISRMKRNCQCYFLEETGVLGSTTAQNIHFPQSKIFLVVSLHGGGGSRLNFGQGCAAHSFKMAPLARPIFLKMIPLARLISTPKVP